MPANLVSSQILERVRRRQVELDRATDKEIRSLANAIIDECQTQAYSQGNGWLSRLASLSWSTPFLKRQLCPPPRLELAMAVVTTAAARSLRMSMYNCQLLGAWATVSGQMIEMQTGEGKTLVCGVAAAVNAMLGQNVHVFTTNAYLASRDFEFIKPLFDFLGLTSAALPEDHLPEVSRQAYKAQIVYGPGYQFGFDYLADQLTRQKFHIGTLGADVLCAIDGLDPEVQLIQSGSFQTAIVDEADSVLIDEAVTPLILSGVVSQQPPDPTPFRVARDLVSQLVEDKDYRLNRRQSQVLLTPAGIEICQKFRQKLGDLRLQRLWQNYVKNALHAELMLGRNADYVVDDGKVKIVDQLTGRIFEDRSWQAGLHQAVEMKESVELTPPRESQVRITRQAYIGRYQQICGMSGTIQDTAEELKKIFGVHVVTIATNMPCRRTLMPSRFFSSWDAKAAAIAKEVRKRHANGQPILIGTASIARSLALYDVLAADGLHAVVLNGLQDKDEALIVAQAGQQGAITIATNMAGRGTDIKLSPRSRQSGGLHVIGTEPNNCRRVDRQLIGRSGRQGDPGSAQFFISADDDFVYQRAPALARRIKVACHPDGESRFDFTKDVLRSQIQEEHRQASIRKQTVSHELWLQQVRESIFGE
ncbi:MAG: preprotein translocase subunit SecA [Pirellula sp.]|jgi:preprotein translocase subunit SecA